MFDAPFHRITIDLQFLSGPGCLADMDLFQITDQFGLPSADLRHISKENAISTDLDLSGDIDPGQFFRRCEMARVAESSNEKKATPKPKFYPVPPGCQ